MQRPPGSRVSVAATPISAKSPRRRAISRKEVPVRAGSAGTAISASSSSSRNAVERAPVKKSAALIQRSPLVERRGLHDRAVISGLRPPVRGGSQIVTASSVAGSSGNRDGAFNQQLGSGPD